MHKHQHSRAKGESAGVGVGEEVGEGEGEGEGKHVMYSLVCVSQHHALAQNQWARLSKQSKSENKTKEPKQTTNEYSRMSTSTHTHTHTHWHSYSHSYMCASGLGHGSDWHKGTGGDQGLSISGTHSHASGVGTEWGLIMMTMTADCGWLCLLHG